MFCFYAGFVDTAGFIKLQGLFTSSITGNLVAAASSVAQTDGALCRAITCIAFTGAAGVAAAITVRLKFSTNLKQTDICLIIYSIEVAILVACIILGIIFDTSISEASNQDNPYVILLGALMGMSMGVHCICAKVCHIILSSKNVIIVIIIHRR